MNYKELLRIVRSIGKGCGEMQRVPCTGLVRTPHKNLGFPDRGRGGVPGIIRISPKEGLVGINYTLGFD